jgi:hypothetical protein
LKEKLQFRAENVCSFAALENYYTSIPVPKWGEIPLLVLLCGTSGTFFMKCSWINLLKESL